MMRFFSQVRLDPRFPFTLQEFITLDCSTEEQFNEAYVKAFDMQQNEFDQLVTEHYRKISKEENVNLKNKYAKFNQYDLNR